MDKVCTKCGQNKDISKFSICTNSFTQKTYFRNCCKACRSIRYRGWKQNSSVALRIKQNHLKYRQSDKGKMTKMVYGKWYSRTMAGKLSRSKAKAKRRDRNKTIVNNLTLLQWRKILLAQDNSCNSCNVSFKLTPPTMDHIIPLSKGGALTKGNTQGLCRSCNASKGNKTMDEFKVWKEELNG